MRLLQIVTTTLLLVLPLSSKTAHAQEAVSHVEDGFWLTDFQDIGIADLYMINVWVDVEVDNLTFDKTVGIRYTTDNWRTFTDAFGGYEGSLPDGRERWGVDVLQAARGSVCTASRCGTRGDDVVVSYAIFYEANGVTYWDNNGGLDYQIVVPPGGVSN